MPCLLKASCLFLMDDFNLLVIQGLSELLILTVLHGNRRSIAPFNSEEKSWNFSLHNTAARTWDQSFSNIHLPKGHQALSLISLIRTFLLVWELREEVTGLARMVKWSVAPTFGSWERPNNLSILVRKQSKVAESLVLNFTICLMFFAWVKLFTLNPVDVGLKCPVMITNALGCLRSRVSRFVWTWSRNAAFSISPLAVEW